VERCTIGRHPSNNLVIDHRKVSRWHAAIVRLSDKEFRLMDFDTTNGTWLNDQRVRDPVALADGDRIEIGPVEMRFRGRRLSGSATQDDLATTIAEPTTPSNLADADYEATGHGIVSLDPEGRIQAMTENARQWFAAFFNQPLDHNRLPDEAAEWLQERLKQADHPDKLAALKPLRRKHGPNRLSIHLKSNRDQRQILLLVVHESPLFDIDSLHEEFHKEFELTRRESEILYYVALGKTNPEIATITGCSHRTVEAHLRKVFPKIGVENRNSAIRLVPDHFRNKHRSKAGL